MRKVLADDGLGVGVDGGAQHLLDLVGGEGLALVINTIEKSSA